MFGQFLTLDNWINSDLSTNSIIIGIIEENIDLSA